MIINTGELENAIKRIEGLIEICNLEIIILKYSKQRVMMLIEIDRLIRNIGRYLKQEYPDVYYYKNNVNYYRKRIKPRRIT